VAVKGNEHNEFGLHENTTNRRGSYQSANGHLLYVRCPFILHSDNGREYANKIIQNLANMWPGMKLVHGKPRQSESQGSVERSNQDVRDMLVVWMSDNSTKTWSEGLRFIQSKKHRALHSGIRTSPYEAMFGTVKRIGLGDSPLTEDMYCSTEAEEELEQLFNSGVNNGREKEDKEEASH